MLVAKAVQHTHEQHSAACSMRCAESTILTSDVVLTLVTAPSVEEGVQQVRLSAMQCSVVAALLVALAMLPYDTTTRIQLA